MLLETTGRIVATSAKPTKDQKYTRYGVMVRPLDGSDAFWCNGLEKPGVSKGQYAVVRYTDGAYGKELMDCTVVTPPGDPLKGTITGISKKERTTKHGPRWAISLKIDSPTQKDAVWVDCGLSGEAVAFEKGQTVSMHTEKTQWGLKLVPGTLKQIRA